MIRCFEHWIPGCSAILIRFLPPACFSSLRQPLRRIPTRCFNQNSQRPQKPSQKGVNFLPAVHPFLCPPRHQRNQVMPLRTSIPLSPERGIRFCRLRSLFSRPPEIPHLHFQWILPSTHRERYELVGLVFFSAGLAENLALVRGQGDPGLHTETISSPEGSPLRLGFELSGIQLPIPVKSPCCSGASRHPNPG